SAARTAPPPAARLRAGRARGRRRSSASGGARLLPLQGLADQWQAVIAEIHVGLVDEDGGRAEATARHHFVGICLELVLDRLVGAPGKELLRIDADAPAYV